MRACVPIFVWVLSISGLARAGESSLPAGITRVNCVVRLLPKGLDSYLLSAKLTGTKGEGKFEGTHPRKFRVGSAGTLRLELEGFVVVRYTDPENGNQPLTVAVESVGDPRRRAEQSHPIETVSFEHRAMTLLTTEIAVGYSLEFSEHMNALRESLARAFGYPNVAVPADFLRVDESEATFTSRMRPLKKLPLPRMGIEAYLARARDSEAANQTRGILSHFARFFASAADSEVKSTLFYGIDDTMQGRIYLEFHDVGSQSTYQTYIEVR